MKKIVMLLFIVGILLTTALPLVENVYEGDAHHRIDFSDDVSGDCIDDSLTGGGGSGGGTSPG